MRIWDQIPPIFLRGPHATGEHNEAGIIHSIVTDPTGQKGGAYRNHPEVRRWYGHADALKIRHDILVADAKRRGWPMGTDHKTPLPWVGDSREWPDPWDDQIAALEAKGYDVERLRELAR